MANHADDEPEEINESLTDLVHPSQSRATPSTSQLPTTSQRFTGGAAITALLFADLVIPRSTNPYARTSGAKLGCVRCNAKKKTCDLEAPCNHCITAMAAGEIVDCHYTYKAPMAPGSRNKTKPGVRCSKAKDPNSCTLCNQLGRTCDGRVPCHRCRSKGDAEANACFIPQLGFTGGFVAAGDNIALPGTTARLSRKLFKTKRQTQIQTQSKTQSETPARSLTSLSPHPTPVANDVDTTMPDSQPTALHFASAASANDQDSRAIVRAVLIEANEGFRVMVREELDRVDYNPFVTHTPALDSFTTDAMQSITAEENGNQLNQDLGGDDGYGGYDPIFGPPQQSSGPYFYTREERSG